MHDAAARNVKGANTEEKERGGASQGCRGEVWSTKQDEAINRLLLFRLPALTESLYPGVF